MIEQVHQQHPKLSIERLCELFSVSRSWYYERSSQPESEAEEIALREETRADHPRIFRLRLPARDPCLSAARLERQSQAGAPYHARGVLALPLEEALCGRDDRFAARLSGLSQSAGWRRVDGTRSGLGGGSDLYSLA